MSDAIKAIVALAGDVNRYDIESLLEEGKSLEVLEYSQGAEDWKDFLAQPSDIVIVACGEYSDMTTDMVDRAVKQRPDRPVVVLAQGSPNGLLRQAFEAGADDVLALPQSAEGIRFALEKVIARRHGSAYVQGAPSAPLICILGPKGGSGKTVTTSNLSVGLADAGYSVAIVDLDLQFGDVGLALGLAPDRTIYDLAKSGGSLDSEKIDAYLARHQSGARVLLAPTRPDQASTITVDFLRDVYATLRRSYDYVVVDTPPGFTPEVIASVDSSSHICLVGMLDSLSLKNTKLGLETLDLMGYERERVCLVLNRADSRVGIDRDDVAAIIGRMPDVMIPSDREIARSVNEGSPIVLGHERSEAARAFRELASYYSFVPPTEEVVQTNGHGRMRLLGRRS